MATEPELIIRFKGDTKDLDTQLSKLKSSLGELEPATNKATGGNKKLEDSNNSLGKSVGKLAAGYLTLQAALSAGKFILGATLEVSKFETQLKTASGSQEKFGQNMAFLEDLSNTYKKNVVDLGASFSQLTIATKGTNLEGEETEKLFKAVTIASSALKMSTDDTTGTFRAFIQMVSKGSVQAEELKGQLGERLYGAFNLFAKGAGKSTSELNGMLERGEILASDILPKVSSLLIDTFSKDALDGAKTLGSNIDYASGQLTLFVAELGKTTGLESSVNSLVSSFGDMLSTLRDLNKESGLIGGFFDRMLTIPKIGFLTNGSFKDDGSSSGFFKKLETQQQAYDRIGKQMRGDSSFKPKFSNDKSTTSTDDYGKQYGIYEPNKKAQDQITKSNEAAVRKRQADQRKLDAEDLRDSKQALEDKLAQSESDINAAYAKYNGVIQDVIGKASTVGITTGLDNKLDPTQKFTNDSTGDGAIVERWANLADATKNGMAKFVAQVKVGANDYNDAIAEIEKSDAIDRLNQNVTNSLRDAAAGIAISFAEMAGSALAGGEGFENAGKAFGLLLAEMLSNIGKALITFATLILIAETSIFEAPLVAIAAGIAAVAAGAYLKTKISDSKSQGFYTGGIVQGKGGVDAIPARLTAGEMVLNKRQQSNMFGMLNGTNTGRNFNRNFATSGNNSPFVGQLSATIRSGDLAVAVEIGEKKNRKFR